MKSEMWSFWRLLWGPRYVRDTRPREDHDVYVEVDRHESLGAAVIREGVYLLPETGATRQGAALAFYTTLSLAPFLLVIAAVSAFFLGSNEARGYVLDEGPQINFVIP